MRLSLLAPSEVVAILTCWRVSRYMTRTWVMRGSILRAMDSKFLTRASLSSTGMSPGSLPMEKGYAAARSPPAILVIPSERSLPYRESCPARSTR